MLNKIKRFMNAVGATGRSPLPAVLMRFFHGALVLPPVVAAAPVIDWTAIYKRLDAKHGLSQRGVHCYLFLRAPEQHEYWITFYFANPALFKDRVGLHFFINHDPAHIVQVLKANPRKPVVSELMCSSSVARRIEAENIVSGRCGQLRDVCFRGGRYIQPVMRHRINPRLKAHG